MNVRLDKQKSADKIDGAVALVNAVAAWISAPDEGDEVIEYSGGLEL
jgi:phage terminase large subunit-like protein